MSPEVLAAIQHLAQFAAALPGEIHPSGRIAIVGWLRDAQHALDVGDYGEAARLLQNANELAALELGWRADDLGIAAEAAAEVTRLALFGDVVGAAERLREMEIAHAG
jgi:hypothetical protein